MASDVKSYVCVNCGKPIDRLYKKYGPSVLKLCKCVHCGNVADKYLEYDKIIILIDLILLSKEAYRHTLLNEPYKNYVKLAFLVLIMVSLDACNVYGKSPVKFDEHDDFYEKRLYIICFATVMGKILFIFVILFIIEMYSYHKTKYLLGFDSIKGICKAVVCSSFGYFLLLTILIWDDFNREVHFLLIHMYILMSQIQALTVTTSVPRMLLGVICTTAILLDQLFSSFIRNVLSE